MTRCCPRHSHLKKTSDVACCVCGHQVSKFCLDPERQRTFCLEGTSPSILFVQHFINKNVSRKTLGYSFAEGKAIDDKEWKGLDHSERA